MTRSIPSIAPRVDLHLHSTASDGTVPPAEVVRRAAEAGLAGLSLTDHDTTRGLEEAEREAAARGLRFLPGAELSANEPGMSVHLLAYGFDVADASLQEFLTRYDADRRRRAEAIVQRLNESGVPLRVEDVTERARNAAPTRAHVARAMVKRGLVSGEGEAFGRYLSRDRPGYVAKTRTPPRDVFEIVHAAGGVVLVAHPGRYHGPDDVRRWAAEGLDGIEVYHPANSATVRSRMNALAAELGLLRSGGSDWHGPGTGRVEVGNEPVPERWMDEIAARTRWGRAA